HAQRLAPELGARDERGQTLSSRTIRREPEERAPRAEPLEHDAPAERASQDAHRRQPRGQREETGGRPPGQEHDGRSAMAPEHPRERHRADREVDREDQRRAQAALQAEAAGSQQSMRAPAATNSPRITSIGRWSRTSNWLASRSKRAPVSVYG